MMEVEVEMMMEVDVWPQCLCGDIITINTDNVCMASSNDWPSRTAETDPPPPHTTTTPLHTPHHLLHHRSSATILRTHGLIWVHHTHTPATLAWEVCSIVG